ncbi:transmembrane protein 125 [Pelodytes ibericus]
MPEIEETPPTRTPPSQGQIENDIFEEHLELWWSREPVKSIVCYGLAVILILACSIGGIVLLSSTVSRSGEWRLVVGAILCILALLILLKQLLSSAIQDMQCVQSRDRIDMLKSGGFSDTLVFLISAIIILTCGVSLFILSFTSENPGSATILLTMHTVGVVLIAFGVLILFGLLMYVLVILYKSCVSSRGLQIRDINVFSISGQLGRSRNTTSSTANLI